MYNYMSKNFNNNTIVDSSLNLQVASLNTNLLTNYTTTATMNTLLASTISSQVVNRTTAIASALTSANLFTSNSLLNYMTTALINSLLASTITTQSNLRDAAISNALTAYTSTAAMNILLASTISGQVSDRTNAIATSLASANAFTTSALSNYTTTTAMNLLLTSYVSSTVVNSMLNTSNLSQTSYINSKILSEISDRNIAIAANNTANLALAKIYTATQSFSDVIIANKLSFSSVGDQTTQYGYNCTSGAQCVNIGISSNSVGQINSVGIGCFTKNFNGFNISVGSYANSYLNCVSIGYNAGNNANVLGSNTGNTYIGSNANMLDSNNSFSSSTCIGINSKITASDQIQLGVSTSTVNCFNITPVNITSTTINSTTINSNNLTTTNLTSTIHNIGQQIISYSTLPLFISQKYVGFMQSSNTLKFYSSFNNFINLCQISVSVGIYIIQYQISYNYATTNVLAWHTYGIGVSSTDLSIQSVKTYTSSTPSVPFTASNSYVYSVSTASIIYLNSMISDFDNTNLTTALLSNFTVSSRLTIIRIA